MGFGGFFFLLFLTFQIFLFLSNNKIFLRKNVARLLSRAVVWLDCISLGGLLTEMQPYLTFLKRDYAGAELASTCLEEPGEGIHASDSLRRQAHDRAEAGEPWSYRLVIRQWDGL